MVLFNNNGHRFNSHHSQSFPLSLSGSIYITRANTQMDIGKCGTLLHPNIVYNTLNFIAHSTGGHMNYNNKHKISLKINIFLHRIFFTLASSFGGGGGLS